MMFKTLNVDNLAHVCICICSKHTLKMYHHNYWRENLIWKINHYCFNWWCRKTI